MTGGPGPGSGGASRLRGLGEIVYDAVALLSLVSARKQGYDWMLSKAYQLAKKHSVALGVSRRRREGKKMSGQKRLLVIGCDAKRFRSREALRPGRRWVSVQCAGVTPHVLSRLQVIQPAVTGVCRSDKRLPRSSYERFLSY